MRLHPLHEYADILNPLLIVLRFAIHWAQAGLHFNFDFGGRWRYNEAKKIELVFIGQNLQREYICANLDSCLFKRQERIDLKVNRDELWQKYLEVDHSFRGVFEPFI